MAKVSIKAIVVVFALIVCPVIFESCCASSCGDCFRAKDSGPSHYDFAGFNMKLYNHTTFVPVMGAIELSNIAFVTEIEVNYVSMSESSGFAAYACSPAPTVANQKITSIVVTSNNDLITSQHSYSSGEDLVELFQVETEMELGPASDIINREFLGTRLSFYTDQNVASDQTHTFTFRITLDNGQVYFVETDEVQLIH